jgi:transcriptional regulator with XRE-family HTH domain
MSSETNLRSTTPPVGKSRRAARGRLADGSANPIDVHVGNRVRMRRTLMGLSQSELGGALGLTFQQVQKYERGANRIGASRLYDLAGIMGISVGYFFENISESAKSASPSEVAKGNVTEHLESGDADPMMKRETMELVRAYYRITDPNIRQQVSTLAKALGGGE